MEEAERDLVGYAGRPHLVLPYSLDTNDSRFTRAEGFNLAEECYLYWGDSFDCLYGEGASRGKMMTIGLHGRLIGRPGRIAALTRFLDYIRGFEGVWICQRGDIARHWIARHPYTS